MKLFYTNFMKTSGLTELSAAFAFIFLTALVTYAAPANDNFANAQLLPGVGGTFVGSNVGATKEPGEDDHALNRGGSSIWYKFVAPGNGVLHFATSNTNFDTVVGVYVGGAVQFLIPVTDNDNDEVDGWSKTYSRVYVGTRAGQIYYFAVDGKNPLDGSGAPAGTVAGTYSFENSVLNDDFADATALANGSGTYTITSSNVGASKESNEPSHAGDSGGKSIWFDYFNNTDYPRSLSFTLESSSLTEEQYELPSLFSVYKGNTLAALTPVAFSEQTNKFKKVRLTFRAEPNSVYHIAIDGKDGPTGAQTGTFKLTYGITKDSRTADFDRDGKADLTVFRPFEGNWYARYSGTNNMHAFHWGINGDNPLVNINSEEDNVFTVFRPDTGVWYRLGFYLIFSSQAAFKWGINGDVAMIRHERLSSGKIKDSPTVFRPSDGTWWTIAEGGEAPFSFGQSGDIPVSADFDGDGHDEYTVFRPSTGDWHIHNPATGQTQTVNFGLAGDIPVPADFNADGIADVAIFRPSTGDWWLRNAQTGAQTPVHFGQWGDVPQPADYDGDGKTDFCVFRSGTWWIRNSSTGAVKTVRWGLSSDVPVTSPLTVN